MAFGLDSIKATPSVTYDLILFVFKKFNSKGVYCFLGEILSPIFIWCGKMSQ